MKREDGSPCFDALARRGRTAFPADRELPEVSPAMRKDRRRMSLFAVR